MDRRRQMRAKGEGITRIESRITTNLIKQQSNDTGEVTREWQLKGTDEFANLGSWKIPGHMDGDIVPEDWVFTRSRSLVPFATRVEKNPLSEATPSIAVGCFRAFRGIFSTLLEKSSSPTRCTLAKTGKYRRNRCTLFFDSARFRDPGGQSVHQGYPCVGASTAML